MSDRKDLVGHLMDAYTTFVIGAGASVVLFGSAATAYSYVAQKESGEKIDQKQIEKAFVEGVIVGFSWPFIPLIWAGKKIFGTRKYARKEIRECVREELKEHSRCTSYD